MSYPHRDPDVSLRVLRGYNSDRARNCECRLRRQIIIEGRCLFLRPKLLLTVNDYSANAEVRIFNTFKPIYYFD